MKKNAITSLAVLCLLAGCSKGPFQMAPVSGVVTLDGDPIEGANVRFKPHRQGDSIVAGPSSFGVTDSEGRYSLATHAGETGAVVTNHTVSISTYVTAMVDPENSDKMRVVSKERVPSRYRGKSELRFQVTEAGSGEANFDLDSE